MIEIELPWPWALGADEARRGPMSARSGAEKRDREAGRLAALKAGAEGMLRGLERNIECEIRLYPRDRRRYDCLNIPYRIKAQLDGVCDVLGCDDYWLNPVIVRRMSFVPGGRVVVELREAA